MINEKEIKDIGDQILIHVDSLNDIYFEVVKDVYSANFVKSKKSFMGTFDLLESLIEYSKRYEECDPKADKLDSGKLNELLAQVVSDYEKSDYQNIADTLLYDFSSMLNDYYENVKNYMG